MKTLGNNLKCAAILANLNAKEARDISARRMALLSSLGEDKRNTVCWRDAVDESAQLGRSFAMLTWHLRTSVGA